MVLKDRIFSYLSDSEKSLNGENPSYMSMLQRESIDLFRKKGFPLYTDEEWRNTNIHSILNQEDNFLRSKKNLESLNINIKNIKESLFLSQKDSFLIIFVNGKYNSFLSTSNFSSKTTDNNNIILSNIASQKEEKIRNFYGKLSYKYDSFNALNTIFSKDGVYIYIPDNVFLKKPIEILHISTESKVLFHPRNLIIVGKSSFVRIVEHHKCLKKHLGLINSVSEIYAFYNSKIEYYKIQDDLEESSMIDNTFFKQSLYSKCSVHTFSFQGKWIRNNLNIYSHGKSASSYLYGISLLSGKQLVDHHTLVDHLYSDSISFQLYKNILWEKSKGIFNGKIIVNKWIKGINAFQKNNNILLSDEACIYTNPQLEIFSDDVKCSHGCTVGNIHESDLFYFQSRGIPETESKILLLLSFLEEVLKPINIFKLKNLLLKKMKKKLDI
ncbi:Fe-S cluster assembly protein SufD [Blattabacterium cuenoti]|uniref:Fe-S cluster assembly protein SufD n=1 Tax=Blattabacterium cuenoti TaxID=1653831 RepID=UPI00163BD228|nr:Fe-S cluster assembly protein SufD [Blattabacterium cuenoti]